MSKHHRDDYTIDSTDTELTRCGDDGEDLEIDGWTVDVKTTECGYADSKIPFLKVKRKKHEENMRRLNEGDIDEMVYYLVKRVNTNTARLIGYVTAEVFDERAEFVAEGDWYKRGINGYNLKSRANNLIVEPDDLWLSFRDD